MAATHSPPEPAAGSTVPRLVVTQDNAFWFDAANRGELAIQRCTACGVLRHPPAPSCEVCRSLDWDHVVSAGVGTLYSWTVIEHPRDPAFEYPLAVGLLDLPEGVRIVADISGVDHADLAVGLTLKVAFVVHGNGEMLPQLQPVDPGVTA